ncbi:PII-like signaling protein [Methanocalculus alkaliphilus]|uniref:DUF190 domain-containing protein n=1 Tax=Methanocalculus alkaliphilus TaxID=768730 RepID=UPI0020A12FEF|nr:DUF190 domain-containing protein [Methanocalculus alkaliphilus]MCP1714765.1 PII-like signaling protein [Methanocalculus alkaliphilus]
MLDDGLLLRIYIAESAKINGKTGYKVLVEYFKEKGFPGCTVFRGMIGFGHEKKLRTVDVFNLSLDLPVVIDLVDTSERIMAVVPEVEEMVEHGLVIIQQVQMIRKRP